MANEYVKILIEAQDGLHVYIQIKQDTAMSRMKAAYANYKEIDVKACRFLFWNQRVQDTDTARSLNIENEDSMEVYVEQTGG